MTSVGYGELVPATVGGKITIVLGAIVGGTIVTCLLRVVLIDALLMTPQEKLVLDVVEFHQYARKRRALAAFLIQRTWRWYCEAKKEDRKRLVYEAAEGFRLLRFTQPSSTSSAMGGSGIQSSLSTQLENLQSQISRQHAQSLEPIHATTQIFQSLVGVC